MWSLKRLLDYYGTLKPGMPPRMFEVDCKDFVGLSAEAIELINEQRTWLEAKVLSQLFACYRHALGKMVDIVSSISDCTRVIAVNADARGDDEVVELVIRYFNSFLREAVKHRQVSAVYDVLPPVQAPGQRPARPRGAAARRRLLLPLLRGGARNAGLTFVWQLAAFDTAYVVRRAFEVDCAVRDELLEQALEFDHAPGGKVDLLVLKAKLMLGGFFVERGEDEAASRVTEHLRDVSTASLRRAEKDLMQAERVFFEVTDRQINLEWLAPERRPHVASFVRASRPSAPRRPRPRAEPLSGRDRPRRAGAWPAGPSARGGARRAPRDELSVRAREPERRGQAQRDVVVRQRELARLGGERGEPLGHLALEARRDGVARGPALGGPPELPARVERNREPLPLSQVRSGSPSASKSRRTSAGCMPMRPATRMRAVSSGAPSVRSRARHSSATSRSLVGGGMRPRSAS
ncbi:MAG: hypothetical protein M5U28_43790, partial [Sandaracinaceae bacterium]|nr:hypothetical protein [Sandaracinaceae bacterium]